MQRDPVLEVPLAPAVDEVIPVSTSSRKWLGQDQRLVPSPARFRPNELRAASLGLDQRCKRLAHGNRLAEVDEKAALTDLDHDMGNARRPVKRWVVRARSSRSHLEHLEAAPRATERIDHDRRALHDGNESRTCPAQWRSFGANGDGALWKPRKGDAPWYRDRSRLVIFAAVGFSGRGRWSRPGRLRRGRRSGPGRGSLCLRSGILAGGACGRCEESYCCCCGNPAPRRSRSHPPYFRLG